MDDLPDNFKDFPVSLAEKKAKDNSNSELWTPRDCIISVLREIDEGKINPESLIVLIGYKDDDGAPTTVTWRASTKGAVFSAGMMIVGLFDMLFSRVGRD